MFSINDATAVWISKRASQFLINFFTTSKRLAPPNITQYLNMVYLLLLLLLSLLYLILYLILLTNTTNNTRKEINLLN